MSNTTKSDAQSSFKQSSNFVQLRSNFVQRKERKERKEGWNKNELKLSGYCRWSMHDEVLEFLNSHTDIDITYNNGQFFEASICNKNNVMLKILINYYEKNNLRDDPESHSYKFAKLKLINIFREIEESNDLSPDVRNIIGSYLPEYNESSSHDDFDDSYDL